MHRRGKITASIEQTRMYLKVLVEQLFLLYQTHNTQVGMEVDSGYRDSLSTFLSSSTFNIVKGFYNDLKMVLKRDFNAILRYETKNLRLYFYIESIR
ncbi:MAG: hypothetical protein CMF61_04790 [Magnetococcales bacterium]|nr:hypothetical protein [Magnetococcales bacterium]PPR15886.1 MAG: hypothetical protein CFH43_00859 [Pseudomonadota bacterium]